MNDTAAFLVDEVFPKAPVRQWVISFPPPLRYLLAFDRAIFAKISKMFVQEVYHWLRTAVLREHPDLNRTNLYPGSVTFVQRFGSALNLHVHLHVVVLDGVYVCPDENRSPEFITTPKPQRIDLVGLANNMWVKTTQMLQRVGKYFDADPETSDTLAQDNPLLAACYAASIAQTALLGPTAGQRLLKLGERITQGATEVPEFPSALDRPFHGYSIHAGVRISAGDDKGLERLLRYAGRGPIAMERLTVMSDGRIRYAFKRPWQNGATHVVFDPVDFVAKLASLVPPYRVNQIRYHGCFAPASRIRTLIVPQESDSPASQIKGQPELGRRNRRRRKDGKPARLPRPRIAWNALLYRTYGKGGLGCPKCGSQMKVVTWSASAEAIRAVLDAEAREGSRSPRQNWYPPTQARAPPGQGELFCIE